MSATIETGERRPSRLAAQTRFAGLRVNSSCYAMRELRNEAVRHVWRTAISLIYNHIVCILFHSAKSGKTNIFV
jgi:hypothetical protein